MLSEQSKCITGYILYFTTRTTIFKNTAISANINCASFWTQTWAPYPDKLFLKPPSMPVILSGHTVRSATVLCCALQHPTLNKWALFIFQHQNHALLSLSNPAHMNTCTHAHTHTHRALVLSLVTHQTSCVTFKCQSYKTTMANLLTQGCNVFFCSWRHDSRCFLHFPIPWKETSSGGSTQRGERSTSIYHR
jgi:hypothetical protein